MASQEDKGDSSEDANTSSTSQKLAVLNNNSYAPSAAGSVVEAMDGFGGTVLIR